MAFRLGCALLCLAFLIWGCDRDRPSRSAVSEGRFEIAMPLPKIAVEKIAWVEYMVVADGDTLKGNLNIGDDDVARGSIGGVPAGPARLVRLSAFNALGASTYVGATTVDVVPDQAVRLRIAMQSVQPPVEEPVEEPVDEPVEEPVEEHID